MYHKCNSNLDIIDSNLEYKYGFLTNTSKFIINYGSG